ncbi:SGS domain-containing protein [Dipodascopsis uninucleata]
MASITTSQETSKIRHEFYESDSNVTVSVFVKNAPKDAQVEIGSDFFSITFKLANASDFLFELNNLKGQVIPESSTYKILSTKIEIRLQKAEPGVKWGSLITKEESSSNVSSSYPTSSKKGAKNWDKLVDELSEGRGDPIEEAGDGAAAFFQKLYADADDDTRRAMMKSYVESNGTALSTNWQEVQKEKMKVEPPAGMEAKKWES